MPPARQAILLPSLKAQRYQHVVLVPAHRAHALMPTLTYHEKLGALPARLRKAAGVRTTLSKYHFNVLYAREVDIFRTATPGNQRIFVGVIWPWGKAFSMAAT
ncbi:hypothetical protein BKM20_13925 [Pseudomonas avellanae]|nr:hypothetical protein PSYMP_20659 [Pseudomonas amygdali pv. morsprunorum str. M302280]KWS53821.1 hypothetical protein AL055_10255 [Pseudomonas amygdali pv. morsprunorum]PHN38217.1 hypothetical protein AO261_09945 [Pseudomonas avellanae]POC92567.1 hypothetical protein BKM26_14050 [Pseudomonas avellanae]POD08090.1 hypothetical protein BKM20_13925 [Pseudomonas avellanae]